MADKLIIDWKEYNLIVEKLAIQIHQSGFKPNMLIGIMRGGAPIIDVLSRVFKLKCASLAVESDSGEGTEEGEAPAEGHAFRPGAGRLLKLGEPLRRQCGPDLVHPVRLLCLCPVRNPVRSHDSCGRGNV